MKPETKETELNYDKVQEFRDKSSSRLDVAPEALSNHLVLKKIFLYLDAKDLLHLSLVNKFWCSTARPVLRNYKRCLAIITGSNPCQELIELNQVLITSQNHPYSGLAIRIQQQEKMHKCTAKEARMSVDDQDHNSFAHASASNQHNLTTLAYPMVLDKIKFRHLEICWDNDYDCPAQKLLRNILKERMEEFDEIKIIQFPDFIMRRGTLKDYLQTEKMSLPKLKILDFLSASKFSMLWRPYNKRHWLRSMMNELVRAAPRLEKLTGMNSLEDLKFFLENKTAHLLKEYQVTREDLKYLKREDQVGEIMEFRSVQAVSFVEHVRRYRVQGYLGRLFPNVTECSFPVGNFIALEETLKFLSTTWPNLEKISMSFRGETTSANENAMVETLVEKLYGISVEEAGTCQNKSPYTMRYRGFSPVVACILSFRRLKKLRIEILDRIYRVDRKFAFPSTPAGFEMEVEVVRTPATTY